MSMILNLFQFLSILFHAALIPYASVSKLECKMQGEGGGGGSQDTTFTSCQNAACSSNYFLFWVNYALEGSTF